MIERKKYLDKLVSKISNTLSSVRGDFNSLIDRKPLILKGARQVGKNTLHDTHHDTHHDEFDKLIEFCTVPRSRKEMMDMMGIVR